MLNLGILADHPTRYSESAIINHNLVFNLAQLFYDKIRIIYFARFGIDKGFSPISSAYHGYEIVDCEGGTWKASIVKKLIKRYKIDILYSQDNWWNSAGLVKGTKAKKIPFYFMTPIDSLPIQKEAYDIFKECRKVFVPNSSYKQIPNGIFIPYGVDWMTFRPNAPKAFKEFTFLWIGKDERRKALERTVLAYEKARKKIDCKLIVRTNWNSKTSTGTQDYIKKKELPVIFQRLTNYPYNQLTRLAQIYSSCHAYINSSKAGACEMNILEANACGLPVLATDWTFMRENIVNEKTGFLIPIKGYDYLNKKNPITGNEIPDTFGRVWGNISINKLADKMVWLVENQKEAYDVGINGLVRMRKYYSWENIASKIYDVIMDDYKTFIKKGKK